MEKATLRALGEGLRKVMPAESELPGEVQAALLRLAAKELKPGLFRDLVACSR